MPFTWRPRTAGYLSYTLRFPDGTRHHGKGDYSRAKQSAREHGYEVAETDIDWTSADSHREAFKDEHERLEADGGKENEDNHNRINSPGKKYEEQDR